MFKLVIFCKKIISFWILFISTFSVLFWYSLVFAWNLWEIEFKFSNNLFQDSLNLNKNRLVIKSRENLDNVIISWDCNVSWKLVQKGESIYVFDVFLLNHDCDKDKINVFFTKWDLFLTTTYNITNNYELYSKYLDYSNDKLKKYLNNLNLAISELSIYSSYDKKIHTDRYQYLSKNRNLQELNFMKDFISDILLKREQKYFIPIKWAQISTISSKLPNAGRPYRESYTNWVHEWWDFDTEFWENVVSLDYWIVIRVVNNFNFFDLEGLKKEWNLTKYDKTRNLDILRWNQVWVKTMKWDVAFYSHLDKVYPNIKVWSVVFRGQVLWTVWISGVPDKNYKDYHLHIELRKNPYLDTRKVKYSMEEYMNWEWYFKWKNEKYILENQYNIFEKNEK